jgi:predicted Zn-dependent protease
MKTKMQVAGENKKKQKTSVASNFNVDGDDDTSTTNFMTLKDQGNEFASNGDFTRALTYFDGALRTLEGIDGATQKNRALIHELRAQVLMELDEDFKAVLAAKEATLADPDWSEGWLTLARAQMNLGEPSLAVESYHTCLSLNPKCEEAIHELGKADKIKEDLLLAQIDGRAAAAVARNM